jgi:hypothetical protein
LGAVLRCLMDTQQAIHILRLASVHETLCGACQQACMPACPACDVWLVLQLWLLPLLALLS